MAHGGGTRGRARLDDAELHAALRAIVGGGEPSDRIARASRRLRLAPGTLKAAALIEQLAARREPMIRP